MFVVKLENVEFYRFLYKQKCTLAREVQNHAIRFGIGFSSVVISGLRLMDKIDIFKN